MSVPASERGLSLRAPVALSAVLHLAAAMALVVMRPARSVATGRIYKVSLIAAPAGTRQVGMLPDPVAAAVTPVPAPAPRARETPEPARMKTPARKAPARTPKLATPNVATTPSATPPPIAGGGPQGGKGADVANVKADGIAFPYPVYLQNIVRQIALNFRPSGRGALAAEVAFMIRRDGTIAGLRITRRSAAYAFDQDALAAVELASRAFGPLPQGFSDDVLPVIFSFDPRLIR